MGNIGDSISTTNPSVGDSGTGYASALKAIIDEVIVRLTKQVPISSIAAGSVGEQLDLNNIGLNNAQYLQMYAQASPPSGAPFGRLGSYAGNLYYVDSSGAVQITDGPNLNAAALNGITGDYGGADPARLNYVNATQSYYFWADMVNAAHAYVEAASFRAFDDGSGDYVNIVAEPTAGSYSLSLPAELPTAGKVSAIAINEFGLLELAETIGPITESFSVTDGVKHGDETTWHNPSEFHNYTQTGSPSVNADGTFNAAATYTQRFYLPAPPVGRRLKGVSVRVQMATTNTTLCTVSLKKVVDEVESAVGSNGTDGTNGGTPVTVTATATETVVTNEYFVVTVAFTTTGVVTSDRIYAIGITHDYV